jgi:hypothetical protein
MTVKVEQVLALADSSKGEETVALLAGLLIVTPANAGRDKANTEDQVRISFLIIFIRISLAIGDLFRADSPFEPLLRAEYVVLVQAPASGRYDALQVELLNSGGANFIWTFGATASLSGPNRRQIQEVYGDGCLYSMARQITSCDSSLNADYLSAAGSFIPLPKEKSTQIDFARPLLL